jgi:outer membrane immunogenic protein
MRKLLIAAAVTAFSAGAALAADLPARTYTKAPMMAPVMNWTGFYIFGGGGYGVMDADQNVIAATSGLDLGARQRFGGHGYFGTAGAGFDYQFAPKWVVGVFGDAQFGDIKGTMSAGINSGDVKLNTSWAVGGRVGYLVAPNVLSYVNAGYSNAEFGGAVLTPLNFVGPATSTASFNRDGWFIGGGVENSLDIFGVSFPGLFMKTEYRVAEYDRTALTVFDASGAPSGIANNFKPIVQTVSTSLVYRFNYGR